MIPYKPREIEKRWQEEWRKADLYRAEDFSEKPKAYVLDMFPYPSGAGLHVGHPLGYIATDIYARLLRMQGYEVLHPMGWDAFGLPAENYAVKNKIHPRIAVEKNVKRFKEQLELFGFSYDWSREINTTDPKYYKWTQWIFLKLYEAGLAYEDEIPINWCPSCKTGLANEEVAAGTCERCGTKVERRKTRQWMLKITDYADRLLLDLDQLDWPERIKEMQRNWIGRSEGAEAIFKVKRQPVRPDNAGRSGGKSEGKSEERELPIYTTRPDTLFGATYVVLAPEHDLLQQLLDDGSIENHKEVHRYAEAARGRSDLERQESREKTGVRLEGVVAINPVNDEELPIFVADYVLIRYGTGAIMAVPAHDTRDFEFATKYKLPILQVVSQDGSTSAPQAAYEGEGVLVNSGDFDGMSTEKGRGAVTEWLTKEGKGSAQVNYKLRDWVFSRQRYWGEPIPLVFCENCAEKTKNQKPKTKKGEFSTGELLNPGWVAVPEDQLPVELPDVESYQPTGTGESPLAAVKDWVETTCPKCDGPAKRETNTMPQWAGSCWYYLRYIDPKNEDELVGKEKEAYWMPVDLYLGGAEHAVLHLLYARFWHKVLYDGGYVSTSEPFRVLFNQGMILGPDHQKMSKSRGNVINPDDVIEEYGVDAFRLYEMFMGPLDQEKPWDTKGIMGLFRFLKKVYAAREGEVDDNAPLRHRTIKKVTEDIAVFKMNTAISSMMEFVNDRERAGGYTKDDVETLTLLLAPFAPHLAEEMWRKVLGHDESVHVQPWPEYDEALAEEETVTIAVQVNGKLRGTLDMPRGTAEQKVIDEAKELSNVVRALGKGNIARTIFVPDRVINFIVGPRS